MSCGYFPEILEVLRGCVTSTICGSSSYRRKHDHAREVSLLETADAGATHGALVVLPEETTEELEQAMSDRCPFVVVDPLLPLSDRIPTVSVAHASGVDQAMQHLLTLGHRRIAAITGPAGMAGDGGSRAAYRAALAPRGYSGTGLRGRLRLPGRTGRTGSGAALLDSPRRRLRSSRSTTRSDRRVRAAREPRAVRPEDLSLWDSRRSSPRYSSRRRSRLFVRRSARWDARPSKSSYDSRAASERDPAHRACDAARRARVDRASELVGASARNPLARIPAGAKTLKPARSRPS